MAGAGHPISGGSYAPLVGVGWAQTVGVVVVVESQSVKEQPYTVSQADEVAVTVDVMVPTSVSDFVNVVEQASADSVLQDGSLLYVSFLSRPTLHKESHVSEKSCLFRAGQILT